MSKRLLIGFRSASDQPLAYATLSEPDANALAAFIDRNVRPDLITCGIAPTFALTEYLRAAPADMTKAGRTDLAVQWIRGNGTPADTWATWTADPLPAISDYEEPAR